MAQTSQSLQLQDTLRGLVKNLRAQEDDLRAAADRAHSLQLDGKKESDRHLDAALASLEDSQLRIGQALQHIGKSRDLHDMLTQAPPDRQKQVRAILEAPPAEES